MTDPAPATSPLPAETVAALTELFAAAVAEHRTAGITWAVVGGHAHGETLLATGAAGHRHLVDGAPAPGSAPMDPGTVSRIASMTKSFTAATVLALREEGALRLDDPVAAQLPEAAGAFAREAGEAEVTLRHLLTMSSGLVTDNPWGDRQEAMTREAFAELLQQGLGRVHPVDSGFEYSNTGYALLGRVIDEVTGSDYRAEIRRRFLEPLGMTDTGFAAAEIDRHRLATGHRLADREDATRFEAVPLDSPGVYGAMAGLFSTTADVARWVRFLAAAETPAQDPHGALLPAAARREMQQIHRIQRTPALPPEAEGRSPGFDRVRGYGYGLVVERYPDLGDVVSHSGGYPGYGSFMVWHRDSGVGVVALANSKYAPATALSMQALRLLREQVPGLLAPRAEVAGSRTLQAAEAALAWLRGDPAATEVPAAWFADNMDLDTSREERLRRLDTALAGAGLTRENLARVAPGQAQVLSPAQLRWHLAPAAGFEAGVQIDLLMDPRREARIQGLDVTPRAR